METIKQFINLGISIMTLPITLFGYTFSLAVVFIAFGLMSLLLMFVFGLLSS